MNQYTHKPMNLVCLYVVLLPKTTSVYRSNIGKEDFHHAVTSQPRPASIDGHLQIPFRVSLAGPRQLLASLLQLLCDFGVGTLLISLGAQVKPPSSMAVTPIKQAAKGTTF